LSMSNYNGVTLKPQVLEMQGFWFRFNLCLFIFAVFNFIAKL
jgi:hypothetical protein